MFTQDIVRHYGFDDRMSERRQILVGRLFVTGLLFVTYLVSLVVTPSIFGLGIWSFSGFAALFPIVLAALFWKRSTRQGVIAAIAGAAIAWVYFFVEGWGRAGYTVADSGIMPVAVMLFVATLLLVGVSLLTAAPEAAVLRKFFAEEA